MKNDFEERIRAINKRAELNVPETKTVYRVCEIQVLLGISRPTAYALVNSGKFPVVKVGRQIRVPVKQFHAWLEGETHG